jgi:hypothetical protein
MTIVSAKTIQEHKQICGKIKNLGEEEDLLE